MKILINRYLIIPLSLILSAAVFNPVNAAGACSVYLGDATINELFKDSPNQANDVDDFVEVKILDSSITYDVYSSWTIQLCENDGPGNNNDADECSDPIILADFEDSTYPWLVLSDGDVGLYFNLKTGFDAILLDGSGNVIDYLSVDGYNKLEETGCTGSDLMYDYQMDSPGAGDKFIFRDPDGTGDWNGSKSAAAPPSEGGSNNPGGGGPRLYRIILISISELDQRIPVIHLCLVLLRKMLATIQLPIIPVRY